MTTKLYTLTEHLVLAHDVAGAVVAEASAAVNLARHQELHPDPLDDDHVARRHVHIVGQRTRDCFICSGPRYRNEPLIIR